jgi:hypothetical protein
LPIAFLPTRARGWRHVLPYFVSNTCAPIVMIAEKACDLIREDAAA